MAHLCPHADAAQSEAWHLAAGEDGDLRARYLRPQPRLALAAALLEHARASMDISDGLMKDLGRMCRASACGAHVELDALPVSPGFATVRSHDPDAAARALFAGDDYEILCAVSPDRARRFQAAAAVAGVPVARIGAFTAGSAIELRDARGKAVEPGISGWDHF